MALRLQKRHVKAWAMGVINSPMALLIARFLGGRLGGGGAAGTPRLWVRHADAMGVQLKFEYGACSELKLLASAFW